MNDYTIIPLSKTGKHAGKYEAIVDAIDSDLAQYNWCVTHRYAARNVKRKLVSMHREILSRKLERELVKGEEVDHIDGNGLNNTRANLRLATRTENGRNGRKRYDNKSGYKGVTWHKDDKRWQAQITVNCKNTYLGSFLNKEDAYAAYCEAAIKYFGEFANLGIKGD